MLVDWMTAYLPMDKIDQTHWQAMRLLTERVMRFKPDKENHSADDVYFLIDRDTVVYETAAWESVRSDSHQIAFRVGSDAIWIQGSPARVCGSGDAVFGEGASGALDLRGCLDRMAGFVSGMIDIPLPTDYDDWHVTRIDVTGNILLGDLAEVRESLRILRNCEGGRYRVSQQAGDTVYWNHRSRLRSGKAYAKGPHIDYQTKKPDYTGREYSDLEKEKLNRLLRLELKLGAQWIRERVGKPWYEITPGELKQEWQEYFFRMIGDSAMRTNDDVKERLLAVAKTEGQAKAAHVLYLIIRSEGWEKARAEYTKTSWYRNLQVLHMAGLGDVDIASGNVVPLRRKIFECQVVNTWAEMNQAA